MFLYEEWRNIKTFPNYAVSSTGKVFNVVNHNPVGWNQPTSHTPPKVRLRRDGKAWYPFVRRLVAQEFLYGWHEDRKVRNINGNVSDNRVDNLEFSDGLNYHQEWSEGRQLMVRWLYCPQLGTFANIDEAAEIIHIKSGSIYDVLAGRRDSVGEYEFMWIWDEGDIVAGRVERTSNTGFSTISEWKDPQGWSREW